MSFEEYWFYFANLGRFKHGIDCFRNRAFHEDSGGKYWR